MNRKWSTIKESGCHCRPLDDAECKIMVNNGVRWENRQLSVLSPVRKSSIARDQFEITFVNDDSWANEFVNRTFFRVAKRSGGSWTTYTNNNNERKKKWFGLPGGSRSRSKRKPETISTAQVKTVDGTRLEARQKGRMLREGGPESSWWGRIES